VAVVYAVPPGPANIHRRSRIGSLSSGLTTSRRSRNHTNSLDTVDRRRCVAARLRPVREEIGLGGRPFPGLREVNTTVCPILPGSVEGLAMPEEAGAYRPILG